jgi:hypothetical protein
MKTFEWRKFEDFEDRGSAGTFSNLIFSHCEFDHCILSLTSNPKRRSTFRNITMVNCSVGSVGLRCAVLEDTVIDGLKTRGLLQAWGAVFRHVVLLTLAQPSILRTELPVGS